MNKPEERFDVSPTVSNHFAWLRTRLALERTIMAWARTSASLIGFGFTIVQFFQRVQSSSPPTVPVLMPEAPRYFGLALIASGVLGLVISIWQYHRGLHYLWRDEYRSIAGIKEDPMTTPMMWVAIVLILVGVFAFLVVLLHWS